MRSLLYITLALTLALLAEVATAAEDSALAERIRAFVSERARVDRADVIVPPLGDFELARKEPIEVRLSASPREDYQGSTPITVSLVSRGEEIKRGSVSIRVRRHDSVLVAARSLPAHTRIGPEDVRGASLERPAPADAIRDPARLVGRQTTRSIAAGTPWREGLVAEAPVVHRGDLVRVLFESNSLRIEGIARAREDGAPGKRIRIQNPDSRRELVGTVGNDGVVHVAY